MTDLTMEEKLSSMITMSDASCATAVPMMPMERPTSASLSAGPSLVPSPVTATTSPISFNRLTRTNLSSGLHRASTWTRGSFCFCSSAVHRLNVGPSIASPSVRMPAFLAMFCAVRMLSPVHIRTTMPERWQSCTARGTSMRRGSSMPRTQTSVSAVSRVSLPASMGGICVVSLSSLNATATVRRPLEAMRVMRWRIRFLASSFSSSLELSTFTYLLHRSSRISGAPLT
mmetsp:Transcript_44568/g.90989  ORF Transcript_44568/g.90989 Transcript_44568/m.90989 type:complete len:229 (+) Transcript_44568:93-779(+)